MSIYLLLWSGIEFPRESACMHAARRNGLIFARQRRPTPSVTENGSPNYVCASFQITPRDRLEASLFIPPGHAPHLSGVVVCPNLATARFLRDPYEGEYRRQAHRHELHARARNDPARGWSFNQRRRGVCVQATLLQNSRKNKKIWLLYSPCQPTVGVAHHNPILLRFPLVLRRRGLRLLGVCCVGRGGGLQQQ